MNYTAVLVTHWSVSLCVCVVQAKQHELHCSIGDALVCAALGSKSPSARDVWTVTQDDFIVSCLLWRHVVAV